MERREKPQFSSLANQGDVDRVANTRICGVSSRNKIREDSHMKRKPEHFTWDDEPDEKTTTFQSSMQSNNSGWQDAAVAKRLQARRTAAKRGMYQLIVLLVALLGGSGWLLYEVSKRI